MKVKFSNEYVEPILDGVKETTARVDLEDHRRPSPGDRLVLLDQDGARIAEATVAWVGSMSARSYVEDDWIDYPQHPTVGAFLDDLRRHYPDAEITPTTELDVLRWTDLVQVVVTEPRTRPDELREEVDP